MLYTKGTKESTVLYCFFYFFHFMLFGGNLKGGKKRYIFNFFHDFLFCALLLSGFKNNFEHLRYFTFELCLLSCFFSLSVFLLLKSQRLKFSYCGASRLKKLSQHCQMFDRFFYFYLMDNGFTTISLDSYIFALHLR